MSINVPQGFKVTSVEPIDSRLTVKTTEDFTLFKDDEMPDIYFAFCNSDGLLYVYKKSEMFDSETGRFRVYSGGPVDYETQVYGKPKINDCEISGSHSASYYKLQGKLIASDGIDAVSLAADVLKVAYDGAAIVLNSEGNLTAGIEYISKQLDLDLNDDFIKLKDNLDEEVSRAKASEGYIIDLIEAEIDRAKSSEGYILSEVGKKQDILTAGDAIDDFSLLKVINVRYDSEAGIVLKDNKLAVNLDKDTMQFNANTNKVEVAIPVPKYSNSNFGQTLGVVRDSSGRTAFTLGWGDFGLVEGLDVRFTASEGYQSQTIDANKHLKLNLVDRYQSIIDLGHKLNSQLITWDSECGLGYDKLAKVAGTGDYNDLDNALTSGRGIIVAGDSTINVSNDAYTIKFNSDGQIYADISVLGETLPTRTSENIGMALIVNSVKDPITGKLTFKYGEAGKVDTISLVGGTKISPDSSKNIDVPKATSTSYGVVKVDGDTIVINSAGQIEGAPSVIQDGKTIIINPSTHIISANYKQDSNGYVTIGGSEGNELGLSSAYLNTVQSKIKNGTGIKIGSDGVTVSATYYSSSGSLISMVSTTDGVELKLDRDLHKYDNTTSAFITNTVSDLTNYYDTSETYMKSEVNNLVSASTNIRVIDKSTPVPTDKPNVMYYHGPYIDSEGSEYYNVWFTEANSDGTAGTTYNLGTTKANLSDYYKKSETNTLLAKKQNNLTAGTGITLSGTTISTNLTAGDGISISGATISHANSITATTSKALMEIKYDGQGHITDATAKTLGRGLDDQSNVIGHSNTAVTAQTTSGIYPITYDAYGHITAAGSAKSFGRGLDDQTNVIGHSNAEITAQTTAGLQSLTYDKFGHITAATAKTLGRGLDDQSNVIGHSNSITAVTTSGIYPITIDAQGHITATGTVFDPATKQDKLVGTEITGQNLKTINGQTLLGTGNITISGGGGTGVSDYGLLSNRPNINGKLTLAGGTNTCTVVDLDLMTAGTGLQFATDGKTLNHLNAVTASTTSSLKAFTYDAQGHIDGATDKTLGRGINDQSNVIGHSNSVTAQTTAALDAIKFDAYGHITGVTAAAGEKGITISGEKIGHSNSVTSQTTAAIDAIKYDAYGHITGVTAAVGEKGITISGEKIGHSNSITGATKGSNTVIPQITYDNYGHITAETDITVYPPIDGSAYDADTNPKHWVVNGANARGQWMDNYGPTSKASNKGEVWTQVDTSTAPQWLAARPTIEVSDTSLNISYKVD